MYPSNDSQMRLTDQNLKPKGITQEYMLTGVNCMACKTLLLTKSNCKIN